MESKVTLNTLLDQVQTCITSCETTANTLGTQTSEQAKSAQKLGNDLAKVRRLLTVIPELYDLALTAKAYAEAAANADSDLDHCDIEYRVDYDNAERVTDVVKAVLPSIGS